MASFTDLWNPIAEPMRTLSETPTELEAQTADLWLKQGTITIECTGSENTYYVDEFDNKFFCKNYPR